MSANILLWCEQAVFCGHLQCCRQLVGVLHYLLKGLLNCSISGLCSSCPTPLFACLDMCASGGGGGGEAIVVMRRRSTDSACASRVVSHVQT